jgi:hypothetical protein
MIILSETTDKLQIVLGDAIVTNQLQCVASWRDRTATTFKPDRTVVLTNGTTPVDLVGSPAASTQRPIDMVSIYNSDTIQHPVIIQFNANGTSYILHKQEIATGQFITYHEGVGWKSESFFAPTKIFTVHGDSSANWALTNATQAARFALNATRNIFGVDLAGYKQVRLRANQQVISASVNTPELYVVYATSYSTTFASYSTIGATEDCKISLNTIGYKDTGWIDMVAGAKADGVFIGFAERGGDGVADPAFGAVDILFR